MSRIVATSESGAEYVIADGFWWHRGDGPHKTWGLKNIEDAELEAYGGYRDETLFWEFVQSEPWAAKPEVGKRLFISAKRLWRLSTIIVDIKEEP